MACPSEEAGPEGEAGCVDDGLQVVVGGDQLGGGALAVLGLHGEGLSENHRQRLRNRGGCSGERRAGWAQEAGLPNLSRLWGGAFEVQSPTGADTKPLNNLPPLFSPSFPSGSPETLAQNSP